MALRNKKALDAQFYTVILDLFFKCTQRNI